MLSIFKFEMKVSFKQLLIWSLAVGGMGLLCILLFKSMQESMEGMAENFASMGTFAEAFGMDKLSIATFRGYFATEIGTIHSLGSVMFAAAIATVVLSKEEDAHTAEFTFSLPVARGKIIVLKFLSVIVNIVLFTFICAALYTLGFIYLGTDEMGSEFIRFMLMQMIMNIEAASICFVISAVNKKNRLGIGIALAMFIYFFDLLGRVIPDLKDVTVIEPLSYANATDIFLNADGNKSALLLGLCITIAFMIAAGIIYDKRDLAC